MTCSGNSFNLQCSLCVCVCMYTHSCNKDKFIYNPTARIDVRERDRCSWGDRSGYCLLAYHVHGDVSIEA